MSHLTLSVLVKSIQSVVCVNKWRLDQKDSSELWSRPCQSRGSVWWWFVCVCRLQQELMTLMVSLHSVYVCACVTAVFDRTWVEAAAHIRVSCDLCLCRCRAIRASQHFQRETISSNGLEPSMVLGERWACMINMWLRRHSDVRYPSVRASPMFVLYQSS